MKIRLFSKSVVFFLAFLSCCLFALDSKTLLQNKWTLGSKYSDINYSAPEIEFLKNGKYHITTYVGIEHKEAVYEGSYKLKNDVLTISQPAKIISVISILR